MKNLWHIIRLELTLYWRGRSIWIVTLAMILLGIVTADEVRHEAASAWTNFSGAALLITPILALTTGDQIYRDQQRRLDGILLSTPVSTGIYVLGKYLAALILLSGLAGISLLSTILTDRLFTWGDLPIIIQAEQYPPLGPWPYLVGWTYLLLVPIVFGAAFVLATITLTRGNRIIASSGIILIWLLSALAYLLKLPELLDILASFTYNYRPANDPAMQLTLKAEGWPDGPFHAPSPAQAQQVVHLVQQNMPPAYLPLDFLWNRLFFLGLTVALMATTMYIVGRQRRGVL